ncbi:MAG: pilus assembly protein TadG-related protein, partial [Dehalococcoidia bacterium]
MKLGRTRTLTPMNRLRNDPEAGQVMIMVALAAVIMFAFVGIAIDVGRLYVTKAELSRAVDAAALSGILELDGTVAGQTAAENKARSYFEDNEGGADANVDPQAIPGENEMTVDATKSVKMYFLSVIGINKVTVKAHARAGFGTQYLDVVMALDATPSMAGTPLTNAKAAAINFKNILLGDNPDGNVLVGMTPFRGCFRPVPLTLADCVDTGTQVSGLTSNSGTLDTKINAITSGATSSGASATNVCTGLAEAWNIFSGAVSGAAAHFDDDLYPNNRQYLVLLSDGDNYYYGSNTYQDPYFSGGALDSQSSPSGATVAGVGYGCQPIDASSGNVGDACPSPWNTPSISSTYPCYKGVNGSSSSIVSDNWDSNSWTGGTGWSGSWTPNTSNTSVVTTSSGSAQSGSYQLRLGRGSGVATNHATDGFESNSWTGGTGWAGNWVPSTSNTSILSTPTGSPQEGSRQLRMSRDSTATAVGSDGFDSNTWTGGTGWAGDWQRNNTNSTVTSLQTTAPQAGSRTLRLGRNGTGSSNVGTVWRAVSLTGMTNAQMTYYTKRNSSFSGSADRVYVEAATNPSGTWTTLATHASTTGTGLTQTGTSWV